MTPHRPWKGLAPLLVCAAGLAAAPAAAPASTTTTTGVTGVVSSELSVGIATPPAAMSLSRSAAATSSAVLTVTSTTPWTLRVHDAASTTPGRMDKVDCATRAAGSGSLASALQWSNAGAGLSGSLSGTPATVATGSLLADVTIAFSQSVGATEALSANDCYALTTTFTVS